MVDKNKDSVTLLLRRIRSQLDELADEITTMLADEHRRNGGNAAALAKYDKETDGKR